jgi:hypothetical protein
MPIADKYLVFLVTIIASIIVPPLAVFASKSSNVTGPNGERISVDRHIVTITGYDGERTSVEIIAPYANKPNYADLNVTTYPCRMFLRYRSDCFKDRAKGRTRAAFFLHPAPVIGALLSEYTVEAKEQVPAKHLPRLDMDELMSPTNLKIFFELTHAEEIFAGYGAYFTMWREEVVDEGVKIPQILQKLSSMQPDCRFELDFDGMPLRYCFGIYRFESQTVWGYTYSAVVRAGDIWTTPEECRALSLTKDGTTYLAAWDSPNLTEEARGVGTEGFSCRVDIPAQFRDHFIEAVSDAVKNSKIDVDLRVKERNGNVTLLAGKKAFSDSKILPGESEYTTGVVTVVEFPDSGIIFPNFSLTVSATIDTSRVDYVEPTDHQLVEYQKTVPKEIETNLSRILNKKTHCDTPFD